MKKEAHKKQNGCNRRQFLHGVGGATLILPFLPSLDILNGGSEANAQTVNNIRRFVSISIKNGYFGAHYYPILPASAHIASTVDTQATIASLPDNISAVLGSEFNQFKSTMLIPQRIDATCERTSHGVIHTMSGMSDDGVEFLPPKGQRYSSIDHYIAKVVNGNTAMKFKILNAGITWKDYPQSPSLYIDANGNVQVADFIKDIDVLWTAIFGNQGSSGNQAVQQQAQKVAMVDLVLDEYKRLRAHSRISQADRIALDAHIHQVSELENRIKEISAPTATCDLVPRPTSMRYIENNNQVPAATRAMLDLVVMAMKCDLTRVANLTIDPDILYGGMTGFGYGHHGLSHNSSTVDKSRILKIQQDQFGHVAYLMGRLRAEGLYDSTLGFVHNEIGDQSGPEYGPASDPFADVHHECYNMQLLLFGLPSVLNGGHLVTYKSGTRWRWHKYMGRSYSDFLLTVMHAMGVQPADYEIPGLVGYGSYTNEIWDQTNAKVVSPPSIRGKPLAGILKAG